MKAWLCAAFAALTILLALTDARADEIAPAEPAFDEGAILGKKPYFRLDSLATRVTAFDQRGTGYQSQAGTSLRGPGSERTTIFEPIIEAVVLQGDRVKHRFTVPIDVVTAASPDATDRRRNRKVDVISGASRKNFSATFDWTATMRVDDTSDFSLRSGAHIEEPFRSWHGGLSGSKTLRDGTLTLGASVLQVLDWFDHFDDLGYRTGRSPRTSTTGSLSATQILTETTSATLNYGITLQKGELGNTWNSVPLEPPLVRGSELLPETRVRHAVVGRLSQFLPWNGALHLYYRFYDDDWHVLAHSAQAELTQRITPWLYVTGLYRFHHQSGASFYTTLAPESAEYRTADSDLATMSAHTVGGKVVFDVPTRGFFRLFHFDVAYERYTRNNDLRMDIVTCGSGYRF